MPRKVKDKTETESAPEKGKHIVCYKCQKDWVTHLEEPALPVKCARCQATPLPWGPADKQWKVYYA
jgi:hypothetical protein